MNPEDQEKPYESRRSFFRKTLTLIPLTVVATQMPGLVDAAPSEPVRESRENASATPYSPMFFNEIEWAFVNAACARLIPSDDLGAGAIEAGVPEFIDRHMQSSYAAGDIWFLQGPYYEAAPEFGYQGKLPPRDILRVGINACGQLIHMSHMDNAPLLCREIALNKALTAVSFGIPTHKWSERLELCSPAVRQGLPLQPGMALFGGGEPIHLDGTVIGGIGVSGASEAVDMECALKGVERIATVLGSQVLPLSL